MYLSGLTAQYTQEKCLGDGSFWRRPNTGAKTECLPTVESRLPTGIRKKKKVYRSQLHWHVSVKGFTDYRSESQCKLNAIFSAGLGTFEAQEDSCFGVIQDP